MGDLLGSPRVAFRLFIFCGLFEALWGLALSYFMSARRLRGFLRYFMSAPLAGLTPVSRRRYFMSARRLRGISLGFRALLLYARAGLPPVFYVRAPLPGLPPVPRRRYFMSAAPLPGQLLRSRRSFPETPYVGPSRVPRPVERGGKRTARPAGGLAKDGDAGGRGRAR